jgi:hypothetical protein
MAKKSVKISTRASSPATVTAPSPRNASRSDLVCGKTNTFFVNFVQSFSTLSAGLPTLPLPTMASTPLVDNPQIKQAELLRPLPFFLHAYVWPFAFAWPVFLRYYMSQDLYDKHIGGEEWTFVWMGSIITVQSLVWLSTHWSVNLEARLRASKVMTIDEASLIKVIPVANAGSAEVCKLVRDKVR